MFYCASFRVFYSKRGSDNYVKCSSLVMLSDDATFGLPIWCLLLVVVVILLSLLAANPHIFMFSPNKLSTLLVNDNQNMSMTPKKVVIVCDNLKKVNVCRFQGYLLCYLCISIWYAN